MHVKNKHYYTGYYKCIYDKCKIVPKGHIVKYILQQFLSGRICQKGKLYVQNQQKICDI
jgi:hypothetical protein